MSRLCCMLCMVVTALCRQLGFETGKLHVGHDTG
jgi:hypothetical protein